VSVRLSSGDRLLLLGRHVSVHKDDVTADAIVAVIKFYASQCRRGASVKYIDPCVQSLSS